MPGWYHGVMQKLVVLISGTGSNMVSLAGRCEAERWPARIAAVISNRPDAAGLARAREMGLAAECVDHRGFASRQDFDAALAARIDLHQPDWIVMAGFMRVLGDAFVRRYTGRIVNIHPSLLPSFPGLHTHRRALAAGVRAHGATIHLVTEALDDGPIVAQAMLAVRDDDDEASLGARVLAMEHRLYPMAMRMLVEGRIGFEGNRARLRAPHPGESLLLAELPA